MAYSVNVILKIGGNLLSMRYMYTFNSSLELKRETRESKIENVEVKKHCSLIYLSISVSLCSLRIFSPWFNHISAVFSFPQSFNILAFRNSFKSYSIDVTVNLAWYLILHILDKSAFIYRLM